MTRPLTTRPSAMPLFSGLLLLCALAAPSPLLAATAGDRYTEALSHERGLRAPADTPATLADLRRGIECYEGIVREYPRSGYSDNALWQAAGLALEAFGRYGDPADQARGERLLRALGREYPSSSLVPRVDTRLAALAAAEPAMPGVVRLRSVAREVLPDLVRVTLELEDEVQYFSDHLNAPARLYFDLADTDADASLVNATLPYEDGDVVREIRLGRHPGQTTRVVIDVEGVESYSVYAMYNPYRLVVDSVRLPEFAPLVAASPPATPVVAKSDPETGLDAEAGDLVADARLSEPAAAVAPEPDVDLATRTAEPEAETAQALGLDLLPLPDGWSARPLAPVDGPAAATREDGAVEVTTEAADAAADLTWPSVHDLLYPDVGSPPAPPIDAAAAVSPTSMVDLQPTASLNESLDLPLDAPIALPRVVHEPTDALFPAAARVVLADAPLVNTGGLYSLGRQLGLGISRVVIDPGHGGYDPGARSGELTESALVLDVAERLESKLLEAGIEVVLTRRGDVYMPLRARTELANRVEADLFLSIHANAAEDPQLRGIETYHLDFATDPTAQAVAARENAGGGESMHDLPDLVRSIAMNNKIDESRDLAALVQRNLVAGVRQSRPNAQDLGVKQAPFMVLIGATMPSVLTEISFLSNEEAAAHLATSAHRDQIAESLFLSLVGYQSALTPTTRVAANDN